jgi:hypothetical protein
LWLNTSYINAVQLDGAGDRTTVSSNIPDDDVCAEVDMFKGLTWFYIIERPSLEAVYIYFSEAFNASRSERLATARAGNPTVEV